MANVLITVREELEHSAELVVFSAVDIERVNAVIDFSSPLHDRKIPVRSVFVIAQGVTSIGKIILNCNGLAESSCG